jgi:hypothetical protein
MTLADPGCGDSHSIQLLADLRHFLPRVDKSTRIMTQCHNCEPSLTDLTHCQVKGCTSPVLHTGLISCSTGTSIPPKVENSSSTSVDGSRD